MKKIFLLLGLATVVLSCSTRRLTQISDVCIANTTRTKVYFRDNSVGKMVYTQWTNGTYNEPDTEVFLVDSTEFASLQKNVIRN